MRTIPAINEPTFDKIKEKIFSARDFGATGVHIDVADGKFTTHKTWNNVKDLIDLRFIVNNIEFNLGVHLMVDNPDEIIDEWLKSGAHTIALHFAKVKNIEMIVEKCKKAEVSLELVIGPSVSVEDIKDFNKVDNILLLAVEPGLAGQQFQEDTLNKIKQLRERGFNGKIIVDGGINLETAKKVKEAGADIIVSASYLWNNINPARAYGKLRAI
jgi:ribulose-phosphate 3-epimerase